MKELGLVIILSFILTIAMLIFNVIGLTLIPWIIVILPALVVFGGFVFITCIGAIVSTIKKSKN